jgi:hypothetical protein
MNRTTLRKQKKELRRREATKAFIVPLPEPVLPPTAAETTSILLTNALQLSPQDQLLWNEIQLITAQVRKLLQQASAKIVARALIEGMKEARTDSSVK